MIVIFVDFDYFFAQVEEVLNPSLKGKPIVVCVYSGRDKDSGAVATANYEARALGVKSGMPIRKAKELAPNAIFLPIQKELYKEVSDRIMNILKSYADKIEISSIDEAYLDVSNRVKDLKEAFTLGKKIKEEIYNREKITVSIGIARNKVLAKIAAEMVKPNGIKVIYEEEESVFLENLPIDEIPGIGKTLSKRLEEAGIKKLGDLHNFSYDDIKKILGNAKAKYLMDLLENRYEDKVKEKRIKHQGRYLTLPKNTRRVEEIKPYLFRAVDEAYSKISGKLPLEITVVAIMEDLDIVSRSKKFYHGIPREKAYEICEDLLNQILKTDRRNLRRIGVRLGKLITSSSLDLFLK
ncbi:MAG: DNA polymerase IV [Sulfolobus sp.]|nr:DNA polymerase IV [Sulfolobus sp.]